MRLDQIQKSTLITESWNDPRLTLLETQHIIPFVSSIEKYITEAQLTPDQISQLFTNVEQGATAAGGKCRLPKWHLTGWSGSHSIRNLQE